MRTRATRTSDLDPAIASYLLDGDLRAALGDLRAREQPRLVLWVAHELRALWNRHHVVLEAEAARRGIEPWWAPFVDGRLRIRGAAATARTGPVMP